VVVAVVKALIVRLRETQQIGKRYFSPLVLTSRLIINPSCRLALGLVDVDSHIQSTFNGSASDMGVTWIRLVPLHDTSQPTTAAALIRGKPCTY